MTCRAFPRSPGYANHEGAAAAVDEAVKASPISSISWGEQGPRLPDAYIGPLSWIVCESQLPLSKLASTAAASFADAAIRCGQGVGDAGRLALEGALKAAIPTIAERKRWGVPAGAAGVKGTGGVEQQHEDGDPDGLAAWSWEPVATSALPNGSVGFYKARRAIRQRLSLLLSAVAKEIAHLERAPRDACAAAGEEAEPCASPGTALLAPLMIAPPPPPPPRRRLQPHRPRRG